MIFIVIYVLSFMFALQLSNGGHPLPASVSITNDIGDGTSVIVHCRSADDDFGHIHLTEGTRRIWKFVNWDTYIWCDIFKGWYEKWLNNREIFNDGNEGYNPKWSIRKDGLYRWVGKTLGFFGEARWIKVHSPE